MDLTKIEFAVQMKSDCCAKKVSKGLSELKGVEIVRISVADETVVVETALPSSKVQEVIESTGCRAILKGYGESKHQEQGAAVAMIGGTIGAGSGLVQGIVRFLQVDGNKCVVDGTVDGLTPGPHGLHIHECGDLSEGCQNVGNHYNPLHSRHGSPDDDDTKRHAGDLGNIVADAYGRADFRFTDRLIRVWDLIGRSVVVTESPDDLGKGHTPQSLFDGNSGERIACGIIARSAGMFQNSKKICACDGVTLWDERDKPLAGPGRRSDGQESNL